ncbi:zf-TFIIB domain-containing protein [Elusimicrobiota bacterium]
MECPACKVNLKNHILEGKIYHKCPGCEGFWFDKNELAQLKQERDWFKIDSKHNDVSASITESNLSCPRDKEALQAIEYGHETDILINVCPKCEGLWLDAGEVYNIHKAGESWIHKLKDTLEDELVAVELFLIKIGPFLPK